MPYDPPETSVSDTAWTLSCRYGAVATVTLTISVSVEGGATEADGDKALQDLVNALSGRARFSDVSGVKSYRASETRVMQPTV